LLPAQRIGTQPHQLRRPRLKDGSITDVRGFHHGHSSSAQLRRLRVADWRHHSVWRRSGQHQRL